MKGAYGGGMGEGETARVLVVDDEPALREALQNSLEFEGTGSAWPSTGRPRWRPWSGSRTSWCCSM
nr:hypothetical protein GCM10020093_036620 [Planobispora longispora]